MFGPAVPSVAVAAVAPGALILDVRETAEWDDAHVADSLHIPMGKAVTAAVAALVQ